MSLSRIAPYLLMALAASAMLFIRAAGMGVREWALAAALIAPLSLALGALVISLPHWSAPQVDLKSEEAFAQARRTARLFSIGFAWGATAMFGTYSSGMTTLKWQHGWQYGAGMALLAGLCFAYAVALGRSGGGGARSARVQRAVMWLTILMGIGAAAGVAWLVMSGKIVTVRPDWAANYLFLAGGLAISTLSAVAVATKVKMVRDL
jgi:hypothetical protein